jgi:hypothetical protein
MAGFFPVYRAKHPRRGEVASFVLDFSQGFLIASIAVFGGVIARRYRSLPPRVALNYSFSGLPRGGRWPRPLIWLPFGIFAAVACFLIAAIGSSVRGSEKIAPLLIEIGSIALTLSYTFDQLMQVAIGTRARMNLAARLVVIVPIVFGIVGNYFIFRPH